MKLKCKAYINIPDVHIIHLLRLNIEIKQPYKSMFGKDKYKCMETCVTLVYGYNGYENFINDCIKYLNKEGIKEEMITNAKQAVKKIYNLSNEQIKINNKKNELSKLIEKFSFDFEVDI